MNITVISNDCTPLQLLDYEQHRDFIHPYNEFFNDHMINLTEKTFEERIHYFITDNEITQPKTKFFSKELIKYYRLVI